MSHSVVSMTRIYILYLILPTTSLYLANSPLNRAHCLLKLYFSHQVASQYTETGIRCSLKNLFLLHGLNIMKCQFVDCYMLIHVFWQVGIASPSWVTTRVTGKHEPAFPRINSSEVNYCLTVTVHVLEANYGKMSLLLPSPRT